MFRRLYKALDWLLCTSAPFLLGCMAAAIMLEIALREVLSPALNNPSWISSISSPLNTLSQTLLVWTGLLGSSVALKHRAHLGVDALVRLYPKGVRRFLDKGAIVLIATFSLAVCIYGGATLCEGAIRRGSVVPGFEDVNRAWFYSVLVICGVANLVYCIGHFVSGPQEDDTPDHSLEVVETAE